MNSNGWHLKRDMSGSVVADMEHFESIFNTSGHTVIEAAPVYFDRELYNYYHTNSTGYQRRSEHMVSLLFLLEHVNGAKQAQLWGDNAGSVYVNWLLKNLSSSLHKRSDGRYEDEELSGAGVEANLCEGTQSGIGRSNTDGDYVTWRDDLKCHSDVMQHSGVYVQGYDNNAQGTMYSFAAAPYTDSKRGILNGMTQCPSGIGHQCGRTN